MSRHQDLTSPSPTSSLSSSGVEFYGRANLLAALPSKKFFVWDFDGSFCDTEPIHFRAYLGAFGLHGHVIKEQEYYVRFTQNADGIRLECEAYGLPLTLEEQRELRKRKVAAYNDLISAGLARPFPEIQDILAMSERLGVRWLVASNSPASENSKILEQLGAPFNSCEALLGPTEALKKKPEPDLFLAALDHFQADPQEVLVIEDTEKGLLAAAAAGLDAICLETRYNTGLPFSAPHLARPTHAQWLEALTHVAKTKGIQGHKGNTDHVDG